MKVIDILNKIANGEEVPKKIKYKNTVYIYYERLDGMCNYKTDDDRHRFLEEDYYIGNILGDEVEIIEEAKKKIEKIKYNDDGFIINGTPVHNYENDFYLADKINELIDEVNALKGGKNE